MSAPTRQFQYFLFSQDFSDGLRTTLSVLIPGVLLSWLGEQEAGIDMSLGAMCLNIIDTPGPMVHKRNGMLAGLALLPVVALLTGLVHPYPWLLGLEVVGLTFGFTLLLAYGNRAAAVGSAGLLLMILMMDRSFTLPQLLRYASLVTAGGLWYMAISLLTYQVRPYRTAQQALGDTVRTVADYLRLKADFYRLSTSLDDDYRHLVQQQIKVSEKQDATRELLFKTRQIVQESTESGRRLVLTFVDVVDLYEHITATYYDYTAIRTRFAGTGVLEAIADFVDQLATELENIGFAIQANRGYQSRRELLAALEQVKARIDALDDPGRPGHTLVLKKILVNLRNLTQRLQDIQTYFDAATATPARTGRELELGRFVEHQRFDFDQLRDHLTMRSGIFRHALRMMLACLAGFVLARVLLPSHHSYWIIMTTSYMLKPAFSLTKERNVQRVLGTLVGGVLGGLVLLLVPDRTVLVVLLALFMVVAFSFSRIQYLVTVIFITPMVLVLFSLLGLPYLEVVEERVLDTLLGCLLAFAAAYLLFPRWESDQLQDYMQDVLRANLRYLQTLAATLTGLPVAVLDYKLARKEVYVSSANLAAAFQRMMSEPRGKQHRPTEVHQFVVLNHILSSNVASITATALADDARPAAGALRSVRQAQQALYRALQRLGQQVPPEPAAPVAPEPSPPPAASTDTHLTEQLEFIQKVSGDISKVTEEVLK